MIKEERIGFVVKPKFKEKVKEISEETGIPISELCRRGLRRQIIHFDKQLEDGE